MVAGCRRPQPSQGGHEVFFDFEPHGDLTQASMHRLTMRSCGLK